MFRVFAVVLVWLMSVPPAAAGNLQVLVYGNWCGAGTSGAPPIDALDAMCMQHDICYDNTRNFDCGCDLSFMDKLRRATWPNEELYQQARAVYEAIALLPCRGTPEQQKTKLEWVRNDHDGAVASGREPKDAAFERLLQTLEKGLAEAAEEFRR